MSGRRGIDACKIDINCIVIQYLVLELCLLSTSSIPQPIRRLPPTRANGGSSNSHLFRRWNPWKMLQSASYKIDLMFRLKNPLPSGVS